MKRFCVSYETRMLEDRQGVEVVTAESKGRAMFAAQAVVHPEAPGDEPVFYFEPLSIVARADGKTFEVEYRTKVEREVSGQVRVEAEDAEQARKKARFTVHRELIPPACFRAVSVEELA
ncbi:hypothetical protein [Desulfolutivibrio sulfoxidireducens]|uniref:hypothetical protein n=1 Tax=Desulfolutivibrio sulfoxidireducens TaxID=2773299 RepID=UPI00159DFB45|nr:hypothetical protein [Desulfolutivibrio sulfoxidireducens]QLA16837.1 hypothetical protein GD605_12440 [Desulfolutivibrio sulfoxidireducens]QLA20401.1 hypothetical protein GD604_12135 [Desulfolutivibrio sulfoxidireducens]